jgi:hypothetical protein
MGFNLSGQIFRPVVKSPPLAETSNHMGQRVSWRYYMHELNISYGARHDLTQCRVPVGLRVIRGTWINAVLGEIACVLMFARAPLSPLIDGKQILIPRRHAK